MGQSASVSWSREVVCMVGGDLADRLHPESDSKQLLFKLAACHMWGPSGNYMEPMLLNVFMNDLDDEIKCTLMGKGTLQEGAAPCRKIWIGWNRGLART